MAEREVRWEKDSLSQLPRLGGVYVIYGSKPRDVLYIAETGNLRIAMLGHFSRGDIGYLPGSVVYWIVSAPARRHRMVDVLTFRAAAQQERELRREIMRER